MLTTKSVSIYQTCHAERSEASGSLDVDASLRSA